MHPDQRHVLFYCDDCDLLKPVVEIFGQIHPDIKVYTFDKIEDVMERLKQHKPELILVYFQDPEKSYMDIVKEIRQIVDTTSVPLKIYRQLPDVAGLHALFKAL